MPVAMFSSCDTFVALPPATADGCVVFGKNSDRPGNEVQEVVYNPAADHSPGSKVSCTYIEIPQKEHTYAVILSKPAWMWGAEMGANEHGVTIGNEAVWTHFTGVDVLTERLLGMDYVRLGLERGATAREAMDVIVSLLKIYGQGGRCFENAAFADITYCNSFIIADSKEAWVLETAGQHWAAERVEKGVRNISNQLSIGTKIDAMSDGLIDFAKANGYWNPSDDPFNFALAYSTVPLVPSGRPSKAAASHRWAAGHTLLKDLSKNGSFNATSMFTILRDEDSGICRTDSSVSVGSQVSVLQPHGSAKPNMHWFTATPNPSRSMFKPFVFAQNVDIGTLTKSPIFGEKDPVCSKPRFQRTVDRRHQLYMAHEAISPLGPTPDVTLLASIKNLESDVILNVKNLSDANSPAAESIFRDTVEKELKIYSNHSKN